LAPFHEDIDGVRLHQVNAESKKEDGMEEIIHDEQTNWNKMCVR